MPQADVRRYETVYILQPNISDKESDAVFGKIESVIKKFQGKMDVRDDWGTKNMAYPIKDYSTGKYCILNYFGAPGVVEEIERHLKILGDVIRYSTISIEEEYKYANVKKQIQTAEEEAKKAREERGKKRFSK